MQKNSWAEVPLFWDIPKNGHFVPEYMILDFFLSILCSAERRFIHMESLFELLCSLLIHTAETSLDITSGNSCFQKDVRALKNTIEQDQGREK